MLEEEVKEEEEEEVVMLEEAKGEAMEAEEEAEAGGVMGDGG